MRHVTRPSDIATASAQRGGSWKPESGIRRGARRIDVANGFESQARGENVILHSIDYFTIFGRDPVQRDVGASRSVVSRGLAWLLYSRRDDAPCDQSQVQGFKARNSIGEKFLPR